LTFSYADYRAFELWSSFMPRRKEITNALGIELYNIQVNPENFDFKPNIPFVKWAAIAVNTVDFVPEGMQVLEIPEACMPFLIIKEIKVMLLLFQCHLYRMATEFSI